MSYLLADGDYYDGGIIIGSGYSGGSRYPIGATLAKKKKLFFERWKKKHGTRAGALAAWRNLHPYSKTAALPKKGALFKRKATYKKATRKPKKKAATKAKKKVTKRKTTKRKAAAKGKRVSCAADKAKIKKLEEQIIFNQKEISDMIQSATEAKKRHEAVIARLMKVV